MIEHILTKFSDMGINVVETTIAEFGEEGATGEETEQEAEDENALVEVQQRPVPSKAATEDPAARTDDPVRIYLRDMGSKELLSRDGEIAIAKRIEAGREAMIAGLCESPLTSRPSSFGETSSTREKSRFATSSISTQPMPALAPRPRRPR